MNLDLLEQVQSLTEQIENEFEQQALAALEKFELSDMIKSLTEIADLDHSTVH